MARLLVTLKLRMVTNALRASTAAKVSFLVSTAFACLLAIGTFTALALLRGNPASVDVTTVTFTLFALAWLILPIFAFGLDSTLDPATLALYPLRTRPLAVGLLAASATGAWPLANLLGLLGVTTGLARGPAGVLVALAAVALQVLFCLTLARFVTTAMARLLRSRRGKDLAAFLIIPLFALYEFFAQVVPKAAAEGRLTPASFAGTDAWLRWLPPGLAAHAIQDASSGHPGPAIARLAILAVIVAMLARAWIRLLGRALVTADTTTGSSRIHGTALPLARYGLGGTVAARFWIYQRRDPGSLVFWAITAVIMAAVSIGSILSRSVQPGVLLGSAVAGAWAVGWGHANSAGQTGPTFVFEALALTSRRKMCAYFAGQDIALAAIAVPLLTAISFALAAAAGRPEYGFLGMAVDLAGLGAALALGNIFTVVLPYPVERRAGNPMQQAAPGYTPRTLLSVFATLGGVAITTTPVIVAIEFTGAAAGTVRLPALVLCAALYGFALAWSGVRIAARTAAGRLPELCQIATRSTP